jgi:hypothetical protein
VKRIKLIDHDKSPSPTDRTEDFRDQFGRFLKGNPGGRGNPYAQRAAAWRATMFAAVQPEDIHKIVRKMIRKARRGDLAAAKILFDRCLGRPQIDVLETLFNALRNHHVPEPNQKYL